MLPYIHIFGLEIPMYGVMIAIGAIFAFTILEYSPKYRGIGKDEAFYCAVWCVVLGFIGAKLLYILVEFKDLLDDPVGFLKGILRGGFVFYGGLIGGLIGGTIYIRKHRMDFLSTVDVLVPPFVIAHAFGRIGCFMAGCCYGLACDTPVSVMFAEDSLAPHGIAVLPTQLFEAVFLFGLFAYLYIRLKKEKIPGVVTGQYILFYAVWRFLLEFLRSDERGHVLFLSTSQFISLLMIPAAIIILVLSRRRYALNHNDDETGSKDEEPAPAEEDDVSVTDQEIQETAEESAESTEEDPENRNDSEDFLNK